MDDIDELKFLDLACAVAVALGFVPTDPSELPFQVSDAAAVETRHSTVLAGWRLVIWGCGEYSSNYGPYRHIAWELDGDEWYWEFSEDVLSLKTIVETDDGMFEHVEVKWADFSTKEEAYATARCRAFLKAKRLQKGTEDGE